MFRHQTTSAAKSPDVMQCLSGQTLKTFVAKRRTDLLPLVVCQCDALWRHLEMHNGGSRWRRGSQCLRYGLCNGLRACQGLHLHWVDVEHVACWEKSSCPSQITEIIWRHGNLRQTMQLESYLFQNGSFWILFLKPDSTCSCRNTDFLLIRAHAVRSKLNSFRNKSIQIIPHKTFCLLCKRCWTVMLSDKLWKHIVTQDY